MIGVILFSKGELFTVFGSNPITSEFILLDSKTDSQLAGGNREEQIGHWILKNGKSLFFSRQSGVTMREGDSK